METKPYKICTKCLLPTLLTDFHLDKRKTDGRQEQCSFCKNVYRKAHYAKTGETNSQERLKYLRGYAKEYRKLTPEERDQRKTEKQSNIISLVEIRQAQIRAEKKRTSEIKKTKDAERYAAAEIRKAQAKYSRENAKAIAALRYRQLYALDPVFRTQELLKKRAQKIFKRKGWATERRSTELFGADYPFVKQHIEKQFAPGMTWANHGEWHIDHKIPLASAETIEEVYPLFHYTNLQPLWAADNIAKSNKYYIL